MIKPAFSLLVLTLICSQIYCHKYCDSDDSGNVRRICVRTNLCISDPDEDFVNLRTIDCDDNEVCCALKDVISETEDPDSGSNKCGIRNFDPIGPKIAGESETEFGEFPWMMFISTKNSPQKFIGGGSLIHPRVVMTVAHKLENYTVNNIIVRGGEYDYSSTNEAKRHKDIEVEKIILHEDYQRRKIQNDIALLILKDPMPIDDHINTICLPPKNFSFEEATCVVTGWGTDTFENKKGSKILKKIDLPFVGHQKCEELLRIAIPRRTFKLHESFTCAGGVAGEDACTGDGGSPLICPVPETLNQYYQAGIVSWGLGCGRENVPGVYVDVIKFLDWIEEKLNQIVLI